MYGVLGNGVLGYRELGRGYSQWKGVVLQTRWRQWIATVKACLWSSYGITQGSHGLRLLGINPSLTRAQLCAFRDLQLTATNPTVIYICEHIQQLPVELNQVNWLANLLAPPL